MKKTLIIFTVLIFLLILAGAGYVHHVITSPNTHETHDVSVRISPGQSFKVTTDQLYSKNLIKNEQIFYYLGRLTGRAAEVKAGQYLMDSSWNMIQVLDHLVSGREALYQLRITEGLTWWQVGRILEEEGLADFEEFKRLVHDQDFLAGHGIHAGSAEGFLYPETYHLSPTRDMGAQRLISIMIGQFWKSTQGLWEGMDFDEIYKMVNLASLIEKETGISHERRIVSGVFHNRIRKNMLLQCDPTIIYGLGKEFYGPIRRSHLSDRENPYNTYVHPGFPPTPICSPGLASLRAAVDPEDHDYIFFVSRNDGSHVFSRTLREHNRAVNKYQR